jgi:hypothetical protein
MKTDLTLIDEFEKLANFYFSQERKIEKILKREKTKVILEIPRISENGFGIGATVETYGIYPWAGAWHGAPWEPMKDWTAEKICKDFFGFVRMLLCEDAQLRYLYRHGSLRKTGIFLRGRDGWQLFEETGYFVLPSGKKKEEIYQNDHLASRFPYDNLESAGWGIYYW